MQSANPRAKVSDSRQKESAFFFEKKNQKTFQHWCRIATLVGWASAHQRNSPPPNPATKLHKLNLKGTPKTHPPHERRPPATWCPINLPIGRLFVEEVITECRKRGAPRVDMLAFEFEMGLFPAVLQEARGKGIDLTPKYIPAEVFDNEPSTRASSTRSARTRTASSPRTA